MSDPNAVTQDAVATEVAAAPQVDATVVGHVGWLRHLIEVAEHFLGRAENADDGKLKPEEQEALTVAATAAIDGVKAAV